MAIRLILKITSAKSRVTNHTRATGIFKNRYAKVE